LSSPAAIPRARGRAVGGALLRRGDRVDVVAPGSRCSEENLRKGVEFLRGLGLVPRVPRNLFGRDLLFANSDAVRFAQLRRALFARDSQAVWCVRGGYGAIRLVKPLLRLQPPQRQKLLIGYSDATTLHFLLNCHWNWPSLHGPLLDRLGSGAAGAQELAELEGVLFGTQREVVFSDLVPLNAAARASRRVTGRVFGGNLAVLQSLLGTKLQRSPRQILFLEDVGERGYKIDRMLNHLEQAGVLKALKAIVLGDFIGGAEADGRHLAPQVLEAFAREHSFPVVMGLNAGHGELQRPVFFNTHAELRCGAAPELRIDVASKQVTRR
jgi:muramoyltetrapeptide carboxypeptidase